MRDVWAVGGGLRELGWRPAGHAAIAGISAAPRSDPPSKSARFQRLLARQPPFDQLALTPAAPHLPGFPAADSGRDCDDAWHNRLVARAFRSAPTLLSARVDWCRAVSRIRLVAPRLRLQPGDAP